MRAARAMTRVRECVALTSPRRLRRPLFYERRSIGLPGFKNGQRAFGIAMTRVSAQDGGT
jgi:hypothetical protein